MTATRQEVERLVEQIHAMRRLPDEDGAAYAARLDALVKQIESGGWRLSLSLTSRVQHRSARGYALRRPRRRWAIRAWWFNDPKGDALAVQAEVVPYYVNEYSTKREALGVLGAWQALP